MSQPSPSGRTPRARRPPGPGGLRRAGLALAGVLTAALFVASTGALVLLRSADSRITRVPVPELDAEPEEPREPVNVLILGSDTREGLSEEEQLVKGSPEDVDGERSDTIILAHFDPEREQVVLVHFPRDLLVEIPGHGEDKINAAFRLGGPRLAVRTVRRFTGLPVHHYVEVDFVGFRRIVDALGGVEVCVDRPMFDRLAELSLPEAGCYDFDGDTALAFARARNVEGDLIPDFARIARQQQLIRSVVNTIFSVGSVWRLPGLVTAAASNVTTDEDVSVTDLIDLGRELRGLAEVDASGAPAVDLRVVPAVPRDVGGVSYVVAVQPDTRRLFRALREGLDLGDTGTEQALTPPSPGVIRVRVLSAGADARAAAVENLLRDAGFVVLPGGAAPRARAETAILYAKGAEDRAQVLAGFVPGVPTDRGPRRLLQGADLVVVVGPDLPPG